MCLGGNPGWITVEPYGGKMSVATLPRWADPLSNFTGFELNFCRKGIEGGEFTVVMGAIDRETSELVADTRVKITVEGGVKKEKKIVSPFHKNIYTFKTIRGNFLVIRQIIIKKIFHSEHSESDSHSSFSVDLDLRDSSVNPSIIPSSLFALDSNGISTSFPISSLSLNGSTLSIERSSFANLRLLQMEVEAEEHTGESDQLNNSSIPTFSLRSHLLLFIINCYGKTSKRKKSTSLRYSWRNRGWSHWGMRSLLSFFIFSFQISMVEESPSGTVVAVFPAVDVSKGENIETRLEGEMKEFFHIQQTTGQSHSSLSSLLSTSLLQVLSSSLVLSISNLFLLPSSIFLF